MTNIDGRGGGFGAVPEATQPARLPAAAFSNAGMQLKAVGNAQAVNTVQNNQSASYEQTQDGRDLLSRPLVFPAAMSVSSTPSGQGEIVPSSGRESLIDPLAENVNITPQRSSPLDRAVLGGVGGAVIGALLGLFILVRAFVRKFGARDKGVAIVATGGAAPTSQLTTEQLARYRRARGLSLLILLVLASLVVLFLYWLFRSDRTVDYYLNHYQERIEKLQDCGQLDMTKDRECMNAYTAQRMFMRR